MKEFYEIDTSPSSGTVSIRKTKEDALQAREEMKRLGFVNVQIKKKHNHSKLSDF